MRDLERSGAGSRQSGRLLVAVDQFEEAFTLCRDKDEREAFVDALVAMAVDTVRHAAVILAIRADFYGDCAAHPDLVRLMGANHVLVGTMQRDELRRAIERPARLARLDVEPELVDRLLADVEGRPGALPLLSTALVELWQRRDGRLMGLASYRRTGGLHGAVARLAEAAFACLDVRHQAIAAASCCGWEARMSAASPSAGAWRSRSSTRTATTTCGACSTSWPRAA
jgi:hypothetical protein